MNVFLAEANVDYGKLVEIQKLPCSLVMLKKHRPNLLQS